MAHPHQPTVASDALTQGVRAVKPPCRSRDSRPAIPQSGDTATARPRNGGARGKTRKTEFYETAVRLGFYGADGGGLVGKKDYVRKYWEDILIKLCVRPFLQRLLEEKSGIRVVDLGSGSGEGVELLTHIPVSNALRSVDRPFLLDSDAIEEYVGIDISPGMVEQGQINYGGWPNVRFVQADLAKGFPLTDHPPFDLYFSSYASLSHLTPAQLGRLLRDIAGHAHRRAYVVLDLMGRLSPEWPRYWRTDRPAMLPYSMGYLLNPSGPPPPDAAPYRVCYWTAREIADFVASEVQVPGRAARVVEMRDRSILVGRHIDTGTFNGHPRSIRNAVNRLFHRDYRGNVAELIADVGFVDECRSAHPEAWERIQTYREQWNTVIRFADALLRTDNAGVRAMIESESSGLADELKMLAWLHRNATRFPVMDFWASIMGPQVACVLRNLELNLPEGIGCGHGLLCIVEISET